MDIDDAEHQKIGTDDNKFYDLGSRMSMLCVGDGGDADEFAEYIVKNIHLYKLRFGYELSPKAVANFARKTITDNLRSRDSEPYMVDFVIGGYDQLTGPYLTMTDYLGTQFNAPYLMYGYGSMFCYSILDKAYREDMTKDEAMQLFHQCLSEVKKRFVIDLPKFRVKIFDADGVVDMTDVQAQ